MLRACDAVDGSLDMLLFGARVPGPAKKYAFAFFVVFGLISAPVWGAQFRVWAAELDPQGDLWAAREHKNPRKLKKREVALSLSPIGCNT